MATTNFVDGVTQVVAAWANDVDDATYRRLPEIPSITNQGALANDTDQGTAMRAQITTYSVLGGVMQIPIGTFRTNGLNGSALSVDKPISIYGSGRLYSGINPEDAASTDNTLGVSPSVSYDYSGMTFSGFHLGDPTNGTRQGLHGIFLDTQAAGQYLPKFTIRDMIIAQATNASGYAVYHLNDVVDNVNGGLYGAYIVNNQFRNGVKLENSGDSISINNNIISGVGIGVNAAIAAGASLLEIQGNNITTSLGAIRIDSGSRFRILGNNIEHSTVGAVANNDSAVVNIAGDTGTMYGGVVKENLIAAFGSTDATILLNVANSRGTLIEDNVFLNGTTATTGINIESNCSDIRVGANSFNAAVTTQVVDAGVGTMGVVKTPTLQNSWVAFAVGNDTLKYMKSSDGMVHVWGSVKSGTTTNGILVATLAAGFRPGTAQRAPAFADNAGTRTIAEVYVETDGTLHFNYAQTTQMTFNFSFPASNLAHSISGE